MHPITLCALLAALATAPARAQQPAAPPAAPPADSTPSVTLPPALDRVLRDYERAWTARDAAGLSALFAEDGFVLVKGLLSKEEAAYYRQRSHDLRALRREQRGER